MLMWMANWIGILAQSSSSSKISSGAPRNGNDLAWLGVEMAIKIMLKSLRDKKPVKSTSYTSGSQVMAALQCSGLKFPFLHLSTTPLPGTAELGCTEGGFGQSSCHWHCCAVNLSSEGSLKVCKWYISTASKSLKVYWQCMAVLFPCSFCGSNRFFGVVWVFFVFWSECSSPNSCIRENNWSLRMQGASDTLQSSCSIAEVCLQGTPGTACSFGPFHRGLWHLPCF